MDDRVSPVATGRQPAQHPRYIFAIDAVPMAWNRPGTRVLPRLGLAASIGTRWPLIAAAASLAALVALEPDRGDVAIYRRAARAAVSTGAIYRYQQRGHGFSYPPFAALIMSSLAWLPTGAMWGVLVLIGVVSLVVVLAVSVPGLVDAVRLRSGGTAWGVAVLAIGEPVATTLRFGQIDLVLSALVLADVLVLRRGHLVGLAAGMKLTPGLFIVFLLVRRRFREAVVATLAFSVSVIWGFVALPRTSVRYWTHNAFSGTNVGSFTTVGNQSVHGVVSRVVGAGAGTAIWLVLVGPLMAVGLALACRAARLGLDLLAAGTVGVTACLISPVSWPHHWVWLIPWLCGLWGLRAGDVVLTRWLAGTSLFAVVSQFVPLKAVGIGYVPIAVVLLIRQRRATSLAGGAREDASATPMGRSRHAIRPVPCPPVRFDSGT